MSDSLHCTYILVTQPLALGFTLKVNGIIMSDGVFLIKKMRPIICKNRFHATGSKEEYLTVNKTKKLIDCCIKVS